MTIEQIYKPGSVFDSHLSSYIVTNIVVRPYPKQDEQPSYASFWSCSKWGLQSLFCYQKSGELLPRLSILTRLAAGGFFLLHFPSGRPGLPLAGIPPCEARTFLTACAAPLFSPLPNFSIIHEKRLSVNYAFCMLFSRKSPCFLHRKGRKLQDFYCIPAYNLL